MRIVFFSDSYFPTINGVSTAVDTLAYGLEKQGHEVLVVAPQCKKAEKKLGYFSEQGLLCVPAVQSMIPEVQLSLPTFGAQKKVIDFKPDVIHTHTPFTLGAVGLAMSKLLKCASVTTHHTNFTDPDIVRELPIPSTIARPVPGFLRKILPKYLGAHDQIVVSTNDTKNDLISLGVADTKVEVIPLPILEEAVQAGKKEGIKLRTQLGIKHGLLFVGRLSRVKHVDDFLGVAARLVKQVPELKIVIVGDGADRARLEKIAQRLKIQDQVIWIGAVEHHMLIDKGYYYLGDVFLTMSLYETQGLSTVEAMAAGRVVAGLKSRGTSEIVEQAGLAFKRSESFSTIAENLAQVFKDKASYKQYQKQAKTTVQEYYLDQVIHRLEAVYSRLIKD